MSKGSHHSLLPQSSGPGSNLMHNNYTFLNLWLICDAKRDENKRMEAGVAPFLKPQCHYKTKKLGIMQQKVNF